MYYPQLTIEDIVLYFLPVVIIIGGIVLGVLFEKIIIFRIKRMAKKIHWEGIEVIAESFQRVTKYMFFIIGLFIAVKKMGLKDTYTSPISKILIALLIFLFTIVITRFVAGMLNMVNKKSKVIRFETSMFSTLTKIFVFIIGGLIILQFLGISITPILTALGVGGLAVALALQDTLSNIFSGIYIIATRQIVVGNYIELETNVEGYVRDITWRNTTIETYHDNMVIVPNSKLASTIITNYSLPVQDMKIVVKVGVSYDSDLQKVEEVTLETAKEIQEEMPETVTGYEPVLRYHTFDDFSINFIVLLRVKEFIERYKVRHEFMKRLHVKYKNAGIVIPFPIRTVVMKKNEEQ